MKYEDYKFIDFVQDEYFVHWVKHPDEQSDKFWKIWLAQHPEKREEVMHARKMINDIGYRYDPGLIEDDYVEMFESILKKGRQQPLKEHHDLFFLSKTLKVAASLAIIFVFVFVIVQLRPVKEDRVPALVVLKKQTPVGQKLITWLEDGTKVHLNAGSSLRYPESFSDSSRLVYLEGEAYFEVTEDTNRPFVVKTGIVQTTVLGTSFNVRAYPDENRIEVAVAEGKVTVGNESRSASFEYTLIRNQMTSYDVAAKQAIRQDFDPNTVLAWTKGIIHFKDANIQEVIGTLERWYGVTFVVNRALDLEKDFSFRYEQKSLEEILDGLGFAFDFEFEIQDKIVTLN